MFSKSGFLLLIFLIKIRGWKDFMFQDDKFPRSGNPYNLFEYF